MIGSDSAPLFTCSFASSESGGQAGIAFSVGGSGGQMSVSAGGAGAASADGGQVDLAASEATARGGSVTGASESGIASPGDVGTVCAHCGVEPFPAGGAVSVFDQSGSPFCIGSAGSASSGSDCGGAALSSAGLTGTVGRAQTGVVSLVMTGSLSSVSGSGGVD